jgi:hypothetical protein
VGQVEHQRLPKMGDLNNPWITQNNVTRGAPREEDNDETT